MVFAGTDPDPNEPWKAPSRPPRKAARRPRGGQRRQLTAQSSKLLGVPVGVAIPVRNHSPRLQLLVFGLQIATAALFVVTASPLALAAVCLIAVGMVAMFFSQRHRILALTAGGIVIMAASVRRTPLAQIGLLPPGTALPEPRGLGAPIDIDGRTWWVDAWDFPRLAQARRTQAGAGGES